MANAIFSHDYKEAVNKHRTWVKTGEIRLFWGLLVVPKGYVREREIHIGLCRVCGNAQYTLAHGYHYLYGFERDRLESVNSVKKGEK